MLLCARIIQASGAQIITCLFTSEKNEPLKFSLLCFKEVVNFVSGTRKCGVWRKTGGVSRLIAENMKNVWVRCGGVGFGHHHGVVWVMEHEIKANLNFEECVSGRVLFGFHGWR
ncbi:hypothetical protein NPIL_622941 [Nephila pilipes]|uniref:Uncharacterized protein n=1 Tax=Nephila pilipes TaxID=299642 RepID=A0A8X6MX27_NEPPI|nr:hypothetical protein NPIL_622941 [Nephila pilipes]